MQIERVHIPRPREGDSHSKFGFLHFRDRMVRPVMRKRYVHAHVHVRAA